MIIYVIVGFGIGIYVLVMVYKVSIKDMINTRFSKDTVVIEGEVVDFAQIKNVRRTGYLTCPIISFSYNGGRQELFAESNASWLPSRYKLGQKVIICYNPNPALLERRIVIKNDYKDILVVILLLIGAFGCLLIGILATYYGIKYDMFILK